MMDKILRRLKSKTYWAALVGAILTVVEVNSGVLSQLLPAGARAYAVMFWPVAMLVLREMTTTALNDTEVK
jgi:uncharacterized membrane protein